MEIMTTWNTDFEFDLQRFADPTYSTSLFNAATGTAANASKLVWAVDAYAWKDSNYTLQDGEVQVGTAVVEDTTLKSITLVDGVTAVSGDESTTYSLKNANAAVTYTNGSNTVKVDSATTSTITVTDGSLKVGIADTDKNATITGTATLGLPADYAGTVTADVAYKFTAHAGTPEVTFNSTTGLTATTAEITVQATNGKVYTDDLSGTATVGTSGVTALAADATFATADTKSVTIANNTSATINTWTVNVATANENPAATITTAAGKTSGVTKITRTAGDVTVTAASKLTDNTPITAGNTDYRLAKDSTTATFAFADSNSKAKAGDFYLDSTTTAKSITGSAENNAAAATSGNVIVNVAEGQVKSVKDLGAGETVTVNFNNATAATLSANSNGLVTYVSGTTTKYFQLTNGATTSTMTDAVWTAADINTGTIKNSAGLALLTAPAGGAIDVSKYTTNTWFTAAGAPYASDLKDATAAKLEVSGSGSDISYTLNVTKDLTDGQDPVGVTIKGVKVTVTDSSPTKAVYTVTNKAGNAQVKGAGFTVSAEGVISDATGTITMVNDGIKQLFLSGSVSVDASAVTADAGATVLTYVAGTGLTDTKVTLNTASPIIINEGTNDTDTVITKDGVITGLDAGATVKNAFDGKTIETAGSDTSSNTYTINGVEWTVTGDEKTTFTVEDSYSTQLSSITNLDLDATVATSKKFEQESLKVNNTTFNNVVSKDGLTFTSTKKDDTASVELNAAGESVTIGTDKYTVSSTSDGVVVASDGKISGLTNGDTVTVQLSTASGDQSIMTLTVNDNKLTVNGFAADGTKLPSTTYTLDSGEESFTATVKGYTTTSDGNTGVKVENGTAGDSITGFQLGTGSDAVGNEKTISSVSNGVYVDKNGNIMNDNSSNKAVGQIQLADDRITYTEIGDKAESIKVSDTKYEWNITTNGGKDTINYTGTQAATINSGAGNDSVTASSNNDLYINLGAGKDTLTVSGSGDHTVVAGEGNSVITVNATGDVRVDATGAGNKNIIHNGTGVATLYGGDGNDTIKAAGFDDSVVGGAGKDVFDISTSSVKISDYTFGDDVIKVASTAVPAAGMLTSEGKVSVAAGQVADISASAGGYYAADIKVGSNKAIHAAWAKEGGSNIDISSYAEDAVVKGDADGVNTLYTGAGNDTIVSLSDNDSVFGGAGKDIVTLAGGKEKRTVGISTTSGKDTVKGFTAGFSDADSIFMVDGAASDVKASYDSKTKQAVLKDGNGSLQLDSIAAGKSGAVELNVSGAKLAVLASGAVATVESASYADVFYGSDSAIDFSAVEGDLNVNLANSLAAGGEGTKFVGVSSIIGGKGANTLMGSAKADSIVAGVGKSSLYGGAGADTLVGNSAEGDVFFFGAGTNTNIIDKFQTADKDNADTVKILGDVTSAKLNSNTIELGTTDGSKAVITKLVSGSINANTMVKVDATNFTGVAKIGSSSAANNFTYDKTVGYYGGGSQTDKLTAASNFADNAEVWLDGSKGTAYGSIDAIDFSAGAGNYVLAGDSSKQTITGGRSESSLWGGVGGSADSLKGGSGTNTFFYGFAEGNDTISSSNADDTVNLYNIKLSDVKTGEITNAGVLVEMNDGSKLTVATSKDITFKLASGETYVANHSTKGWDKA